MKRKILSLSISVIMILSLFTACQSSSAGTTAETEAETEVEETVMEEAGYDLEDALADAAVARFNQTGLDEDIYIAAVEGLSEDFIMGMDISSLLAEEASGVVYYNEAGEEEDIFKILSDAGVNYVRVRVWNDPYDEDGNGYGGGNCDAQTAATIGARAAEYGIKLMVDFHYSDFWADPNKQYSPVAWEDADIDEKAELIAEYTRESLETIIAAGADVGMVQLGNEINYGLSGVTETEDIMTLIKAASAVVREIDSQIQIVIHYTSIDDPDATLEHAENLANAEIDYDIFGVSYYVYWHSTLENMQSVLTDIQEIYGVKTCIMETAYPYTTEDGDGSANSVDESDLVDEYPATVQGQASCIRDIIQAASDVGAIGIFYWEGAWVPVSSDYDANTVIWEALGSGWASSYAGVYDPDDAGIYYGGCSWENQAMFDFNGKALASLNVFNYVYTGHTIDLAVIAYLDTPVTVALGEELVMPAVANVIYNDSTNDQGMAVTWDEEQVLAIDTETAGTYTVDGITEDGTAVISTVNVKSNNCIVNPGFEEEDASMWVVSYITEDTDQTDIQNKAADALSGSKAFHFWSAGDVGFTVEQELVGLEAGSYTAVINMQGNQMGDESEIYLYVLVDDILYTAENITLTGWVQWVTSTITDIEVSENSKVTLGIYVSGAAGGWGTIDDVEFYK